MSKKKLPLGYTWFEDRQLYRCRFSYEGKRYSVCGRTKDICEEKKAEKLKALKEHMNIDNQRITLGKYYDSIFYGELEKSVKPSTLYSYDKLWKHIKPELAAVKVKDINKPMVLQLQNALKQKRTAETANRCVKYLKQILKSAVLDRIISFNPCDSVKPLKVEKKETENHRVLTPEEMKVFLDNAKSCHYYNLFRFLNVTGCRIGETIALTWKDIDFENDEIRISSTVSRVSDRGFDILDTPKTDTSNRTIPLKPEVKKILADQKRQNVMLSVQSFDKQLVFPNSRGGVANYNNINNCIDNILKNIENNPDVTPIEHFTCHAFRHSFATNCAESGMTPGTLKALMGHSNINITMSYYVHATKKAKQEELDKVRFVI